jgi:protocatechuate 3,4-dioxygenase beta subunit
MTRWCRMASWLPLTWALILVVVGHVSGAPAGKACAPTRADSEGPFYKPDAPQRDRTGQGLVIAGAVRSSADCRPLPGARIEWWSANSSGEYDDQHRAVQRGDAEGRYRYETDRPGRYPGRPPHVHVRVVAPGHRTLVTQLYPAPNQASLPVDFVLVPE